MTREIEARLKVSAVDKTGAALKSVSSRLDQVNKRAAALNRQHSVLTRTAETSYAALARYAAPAVLAYGAKKALTDFADLERQLTRIGMTAGVSKQETDAALQSMQKQAKDLALPLDDAISALEVLTASGMDFKDAMAYLPSVLATTQATGAAAADMAQTTFQASNALKISAGEMQRVFDIINEAGKAGSFEAKDMATYLPSLANGFAALGYKGAEAISDLSAYMQTLRAHTADSSTAANQMQNILAKMYSEETANKFKKFGINLEAEMKKRTKAGQKPLEAFIELSREALGGDMTKLSRLFTDMQVQQGMLSLITDAETFRRVIDIINSSRVDGSVQRDNQRILGETKASLDRLAESWRQLQTAAGSAIAPVATPVIEGAVKDLDRYNARQRGMEKRGWSWRQRNLGVISEQTEMDLAYEGGYRDKNFVSDFWASRYGAGRDDPRRPKASRGRQNSPVVIPEFPGGGRNYTNRTLPASAAPIPGVRPPNVASTRSPLADLQQQYAQYGKGRELAEEFTSAIANMDVFRGVREKLEASTQQIGDQAAKSIADGGQEGAGFFDKAAASIVTAGNTAAQAIQNAVSNLQTATQRAQSLGANMGSRLPVNADTGRSMPPSANRPGSTGGQY